MYLVLRIETELLVVSVVSVGRLLFVLNAKRYVGTFCQVFRFGTCSYDRTALSESVEPIHVEDDTGLKSHRVDRLPGLWVYSCFNESLVEFRDSASK